jgi:hypothetical protein
MHRTDKGHAHCAHTVRTVRHDHREPRIDAAQGSQADDHRVDHNSEPGSSMRVGQTFPLASTLFCHKRILLPQKVLTRKANKRRRDKYPRSGDAHTTAPGRTHRRNYNKQQTKSMANPCFPSRKSNGLTPTPCIHRINQANGKAPHIHGRTPATSHTSAHTRRLLR